MLEPAGHFGCHARAQRLFDQMQGQIKGRSRPRGGHAAAVQHDHVFGCGQIGEFGGKGGLVAPMHGGGVAIEQARAG